MEKIYDSKTLLKVAKNELTEMRLQMAASVENGELSQDAANKGLQNIQSIYDIIQLVCVVGDTKIWMYQTPAQLRKLAKLAWRNADVVRVRLRSEGKFEEARQECEIWQQIGKTIEEVAEHNSSARTYITQTRLFPILVFLASIFTSCDGGEYINFRTICENPTDSVALVHLTSVDSAGVTLDVAYKNAIVAQLDLWIDGRTFVASAADIDGQVQGGNAFWLEGGNGIYVPLSRTPTTWQCARVRGVLKVFK